MAITTPQEDVKAAHVGVVLEPVVMTLIPPAVLVVTSATACSLTASEL